MIPSSWLPANRRSGAVVYALFIPAALMPFVIYEAARRTRVVDVRFTFARGTTLALTGFLWLFVFAFAEVQVERGMADTASGVILLIVLALVSVSFEHIRHGLNSLCDALFFRTLHRAQAAFKQASAEVDDADGVDALERLIVDRPLTTLKLASAAIFRHEGANSTACARRAWARRARTISHAPTRSSSRSSRRGNRAASSCRRHGRISGRRRDAGADRADALAQGDVRGRVGGHAQGDALVKEEEELLCGFLEQAATAYREAGLRARIAELEAAEAVPPILATKTI